MSSFANEETEVQESGTSCQRAEKLVEIQTQNVHSISNCQVQYVAHGKYSMNSSMYDIHYVVQNYGTFIGFRECTFIMIKQLYVI